jgi:hypothetical protein
MRLDSRGGSRIVKCPDCGAKKGERCMNVGADRGWQKYRKLSHYGRIRAAEKHVEKLDRKKRLSAEETLGIKQFLDELRLRTFGGLGPTIQGRALARDTAIAAVERLLKTRGAR